MTSQHTTRRDDLMNSATAGTLTGYTGIEKDSTLMAPQLAADYDDVGSGAGRGYGGVDDDEDEELEDLTVDDEDDAFADEDDDDFDEDDEDIDDEDLDDDVEDDIDDDSTLRGRW
ncbi:hypothetical protein GCM10023187_22850 [Nibrella viscosa]|uniref:DNA primase n=1 Tax=Nibrella viscosa TaxID=1084524 RepID=A0ABP8KEH1_9BACT